MRRRARLANWAVCSLWVTINTAIEDIMSHTVSLQTKFFAALSGDYLNPLVWIICMLQITIKEIPCQSKRQRPGKHNHAKPYTLCFYSLISGHLGLSISCFHWMQV